MPSTPASSFSDQGDSGIKTLAKTKVTSTPAALPSPPTYPSELSEPDPLTDTDDERDRREEEGVINDILQAVRDRYHDRPVRDYPTFYLRGQQSYSRLLEKLKQHGLIDFFQGIRSRWNATSGRLTLIFMADAIHEVLKQEFDFELRTELNRLARDFPSIQPLRDHIVAAGHAHVNKNKDFKRSPDGQQCFQAFKYPPFVYEIAHSQRQNDLDEAVEEYFDKLPGSVGALLTFKFDYNPKLVGTPEFSYTGWVSLWTARIEGDTLHQILAMDNVVFRRHGETLPGTLVLPFELFLPPAKRNTIPEDAQDAKICFDFARLGSWVSLAERRQRVSKEKTPVEEAQASTSLKRRITWDTEMKEVHTKQFARVPKRQRMDQSVQPVALRTRSASRPRTSGRQRSRSQGSSSGR